MFSIPYFLTASSVHSFRMRHFVVTGNTLLWLYTIINCSVFDVRQCRLLVVNKILEEPRFSVELEAAGSAGLWEVTFQQPTSSALSYNASLNLSRNFLFFTKYVVRVFHLPVIFIWA
jgi:hypothetical protein